MSFIIVKRTFQYVKTSEFVYGVPIETKYVDILGAYDNYNEAEKAINKFLEVFPSKSTYFRCEYTELGIDRPGETEVKDVFIKEPPKDFPLYTQNPNCKFERMFIFDRVTDDGESIGRKRVSFYIFEVDKLIQEKEVEDGVFAHDDTVSPRRYAHFSSHATIVKK